MKLVARSGQPVPWTLVELRRKDGLIQVAGFERRLYGSVQELTVGARQIASMLVSSSSMAFALLVMIGLAVNPIIHGTLSP